ncbi:hypothetical protein ACHAWF_014344 [Thalassiosira exigua]
MMREAQKMMNDPAFQERMKQYTENSEFKESMEKTQDMMKDKEKMKEMEESMKKRVEEGEKELEEFKKKSAALDEEEKKKADEMKVKEMTYFRVALILAHPHLKVLFVCTLAQPKNKKMKVRFM